MAEAGLGDRGVQLGVNLFGGPFLYDPWELYALGLLSNPNTLENKMACSTERFRSSYPFLLCPLLSIAFCAPVNKVQSVFNNRAGNATEWSAAALVK